MAMVGSRRIVLLIFGLFALTIIVTTLSVSVVYLPGALRRGVVSTLQNRFQSDVQIEDLQVGVFPNIHATAHGIVLRLHGRTDVPPLITIQKFVLSATIAELFRRHISSIQLQGLQIHIPPPALGAVPNQGIKPGKKIHFPLVIDEIVSDDAVLETLPRDAKHIPRDFNIHHLVLDSFSFENPASFHATLTNPLPLGEIASEGQFGPWQGEQPGNTMVSGTFRYSHVDFSSIHGLSGNMSSSGNYSGTLDRISVEGDTEMPNFALAVAGNPMPLATHYRAVVDGTNGNTYLESVEARLGDSPISVTGQIVGIRGVQGRLIALDATSHNARTEDLLGLAVKGGAPMKGSINLHVKINVPPGPPGQDILEHLELNGQFGLGQTHFTNADVQKKLDSLSRAGQGQPKDEEIANVVSNLRGNFLVTHGVVRLTGVEFDVPGSTVQLDGFYGMESEDIDFHGHLLLDVKLSQTTTGVKSVALKLVDPFFKQAGGGSSIPIKITGNPKNPNFGLDLRRSRVH
jgi:hypothetical protein